MEIDITRNGNSKNGYVNQHNGRYSRGFIATTAPRIPSMCGSQDQWAQSEPTFPRLQKFYQQLKFTAVAQVA